MFTTAAICIACFLTGAACAVLAGRPRPAHRSGVLRRTVAREEAERQWDALMAYDGTDQEDEYERHSHRA